jgi:ADP-ribose pyrophosphatase
MNQDIELLEKTEAYQGYFRIVRYRLRHRLFAGGWSGEVRREVFERGHAVGVLPYDPAADAVVLIEQFRIGAFVAHMDPWLTEVVAGIIEEDESPEVVARRETREEAGIEIQDMMPMCRYIVSPGGSSETVRLYCARVDSRGAGGIHGLAEEHEDIRVLVLPFAEAMTRVEDGGIANAVSLIALQWLALHRDQVRAAWG